MTGIGSVLARLGLAQYTAAFVNEGFDTWETVLDITESDLDVLNVKLGHRRKLQREIANELGIGIGQVVPSPTLAKSIEEGRVDAIGESAGGGKSGGSRHNTGGSGKRKYRRHPKPDENAPERPPSAYVIFSSKVREGLRPQNLSFTEIAKRVGERWQLLATDEKEPYESQAGFLKDKYSTELVKYKRTNSYREYSQYLIDFKAKNAAPNVEPKRPKLEAQNSTGSSASEGSRHGKTRPLGDLSSLKVGSSALGYASPTVNTMTPLLLNTKVQSPASLSPLTYSPYTDSSASRGLGSTIAYSATEGRPNWGSEGSVSGQPLGQLSTPLPRIVPVDDRDIVMRQGSMPPVVTDAPIPRGPGLSHMQPRRSNHVPASFLRSDTRSSISSNRSSNLSSGTTASPSTFTPAAPIEDARKQRALPPPVSTPSPGGASTLSGDQSHPMGFTSTSSQQPPGHSHTSSLGNAFTLPSPTGRHLASEHLASYPHPGYDFDPQPSPRNRVADRYGTYSDVPQERRLLMNLSLAGSPKESASSPRNRIYDFRDAEHPLDRRTQQPLSRPNSQAFDHSPATWSREQRSSEFRGTESEGQGSPQRLDGLSVLALAGRMVDRNERERP